MWRVLPKPFVMMDRPGYRRGVDQRDTCAVEPKAYDWGSSKSSLAMGARSPFKGIGGGPTRSEGSHEKLGEAFLADLDRSWRRHGGGSATSSRLP